MEELDRLSLVDLVALVVVSRRGSRALGPARVAAAALLDASGDLAELSRAEPGALVARLGALGCAHAARAGPAIAAAFELGRRAAVETARAPPRVASSADVAAWAIPRLGGLAHEELWIVALDGRSRVRATRQIAKGGLHGVGARAADPLRAALRADASAFVLVHNHPSGDATPSAEDVTFTTLVARAAETVGVPLLDHVVVTREGFASVPVQTYIHAEGGGMYAGTC